MPFEMSHTNVCSSRVFRDDTDMTEMTLPVCLTDAEVSSIEEVVQQLKLTMIHKYDKVIEYF